MNIENYTLEELNELKEKVDKEYYHAKNKLLKNIPYNPLIELGLNLFNISDNSTIKEIVKKIVELALERKAIQKHKTDSAKCQGRFVVGTFCYNKDEFFTFTQGYFYCSYHTVMELLRYGDRRIWHHAPFPDEPSRIVYQQVANEIVYKGKTPKHPLQEMADQKAEFDQRFWNFRDTFADNTCPFTKLGLNLFDHGSLIKQIATKVTELALQRSGITTKASKICQSYNQTCLFNDDHGYMMNSGNRSCTYHAAITLLKFGEKGLRIGGVDVIIPDADSQPIYMELAKDIIAAGMSNLIIAPTIG